MDLIEYLRPEALPAGVADRIAAAVGVDQAQIPSFAESLAVLFQLARNNHAWDIRAAQGRDLAEIQLSELRELLTSLAKRIEDFAPSTRRHFGLFALRQRRFGLFTQGEALRMEFADLLDGGGMDEGESIVSSYLAIVGEMLAAASTNVWPKGGDGRPPTRRLMERSDAAGHPAVKAFDFFVLQLVELILDCGGRRPTLNKNTGKGQLIDALRIAQPHLPKGLIPAGLLEPDEDGKHFGMSQLADLRDLGMKRGQKRRPK
jgi:hypothetical protein